MWLLLMITASIALRFELNPSSRMIALCSSLSFPFFLVGMVVFRMMPALTFIATRLGPIDAALGALSYPVYISHMLVFGLLYQTPALSLPWTEALPPRDSPA